MNAALSKAFRSVQIYFPGLQDLRFRIQRNVRGLLHKPHEHDFEALVHLPYQPNALFLDIGSNRGDAIQSILMQRPDARVMAFEPNTHLTDKVKKIYKNDPRVEVQNFGLGSKPGSFELFIPFYNRYMFDGLASFKERRARRWLENRLYGFRSEKLHIERMVCEVKRVDDLQLDPYFIKIDVQGFEYDVLVGARNTLATSQPILLIETPDSREIEFLSSLGYKPYVYRQSRFHAGLRGMNVFFFHDVRHSTMSDHFVQ